MSSEKDYAPAKITKYWLPIERISRARVEYEPELYSIAIDDEDIWFYMRDSMRGQSIGQIKLKDSKAEFNQYVLREGITDKQIEDTQRALERGITRFPESWRSIGRGITAHNGYVWYSEREGIYRRKPVGRSSWTGTQVPKKQTLCKMNTKTHRVTRYLFPSPDEVSLSQFPWRLGLDSSGRRVWGATNGLSAWVFDTTTNKLKLLTIGKVVERKFKERVVKMPEHRLRDVAIETDGKRGWLVDYNEALYLFDLEDESLLKYGLTDLRPRAMVLAPDGKIWCTAVTHERCRERLPRNQGSIDKGYILSLDPKTNELTTYPGYQRPEGILVTDKEEIWFGFGWGRPDVEYGISKLNHEETEGSTTVITTKEPEEWELKEYDVTEVKGEEISPKTFDLYPDQPIKREYPQPPRIVGSERGPIQFLIYPLEYRPHTTVNSLMQDSQGRIWFTTWVRGYIGVLTP